MTDTNYAIITTQTTIRVEADHCKRTDEGDHLFYTGDDPTSGFVALVDGDKTVAVLSDAAKWSDPA